MLQKRNSLNHSKCLRQEVIMAKTQFAQSVGIKMPTHYSLYLVQSEHFCKAIPIVIAINL